MNNQTKKVRYLTLLIDVREVNDVNGTLLLLYRTIYGRDDLVMQSWRFKKGRDTSYELIKRMKPGHQYVVKLAISDTQTGTHSEFQFCQEVSLIGDGQLNYSGEQQ